MRWAQMDCLSEQIVDSFSGGGGTSTGLEQATGRVVDIAINHDPDAIRMHVTNHPYTRHYQESVWDIDPREVCMGRPVGLLWASPDCKHFSRAKGRAPVDRNIRGLAWVVLRWAGTVKPRVIILENVPEFQTWGPVRRGRPVRSKSGQTFRRFVDQLESLGYSVAWRELVASDYGAPTIRRRFFLIARCDGRPIVWPERTHAPADSEEVRIGKCKPWRSAAEIIDWSLPMYSVFASKEEIRERYGASVVRPLAENTMRRVIRGVDKFTIRSGKPYITFSNTGGSVGSPVDQPVGTVRTAGGQVLSAAHLAQYHTEQAETVRGQGLRSPLQTVDASNRYGLVSANLVEYFSTGRPLGLEDPLHTVTSHDREGLAAAHICKYYGDVVGSSAGSPLPTVTAVDHNALSVAHIVKFKGDNLGHPMDQPLQTITAHADPFALCTAVIATAGTGMDLGHWPEVRELLNRYCGYHLAADEIILLVIGGAAYYIRDILLRMLTPRELYNAMGFPPDYIIDRDYTGRAYSRAAQVARCGNAVPPPFAAALVRANLPEWCGEEITTMEQFGEVVAV